MQPSAVIWFIVLLVATYFICGIPFGLIFSKRQGVDVRTVGSGNIGTTNVARSVGAKTAVLTMVLDMLKGFVCTFAGATILAAIMDVPPALVLPGGTYGWTITWIFFVAVVGHVFSPYLHFKGGKGVATAFGAALGFSAPLALGMLVVWALTTVPSRYVSLGSVIAAMSCPVLGFFLFYPPSISLMVPLVLVAALVVWAHRSNIAKLRAGTESTFSIKHKDATTSSDEKPTASTSKHSQ